MWESRQEAEAVESRQLEYDKMAKTGEKRLMIMIGLDLLSVILYAFAVKMITSPVIILILLLMGASELGIYKNLDIGFYAFFGAMMLSTAIWLVTSYKIIILVNLLFGKDVNVSLVFELISELTFMISYILSVKLMFFDKNVYCWKNYRRKR